MHRSWPSGTLPTVIAGHRAAITRLSARGLEVAVNTGIDGFQIGRGAGIVKEETATLGRVGLNGGNARAFKRRLQPLAMEGCSSFFIFSYCGSGEIECRLMEINAGSFAGIVGPGPSLVAASVG
ncbi:hypothetical protein D3C81_811620 [compost metagenome]